MKTWITLAAVSMAFAGCEKSARKVENYGTYQVIFPNGFQKVTGKPSEEVVWATQDHIVEIRSAAIDRPATDFGSLHGFKDWIAAELKLPFPEFFEAANGLHIAVNTTEEATQIVIVYPKPDKQWRATIFSVSGAFTNDHRLRATRERAIAAVMAGRISQE
jgi:hypothetical protein